MLYYIEDLDLADAQSLFDGIDPREYDRLLREKVHGRPEFLKHLRRLYTPPDKRPAPTAILELGCGTGQVGLGLRRIFGKNVYLCGVDIAPGLAAFAAARMKNNALVYDSVVTGSITDDRTYQKVEERAGADMKFSLAVEFSTFERMSERRLRQVFGQVSDRLEEKGCFAFTTLVPARRVPDGDYAAHDQGVVRGMLEDAGLRALDHRAPVIPAYVFPAGRKTQPLFYRVWLAEKTGAPKVRP